MRAVTRLNALCCVASALAMLAAARCAYAQSADQDGAGTRISLTPGANDLEQSLSPTAPPTTAEQPVGPGGMTQGQIDQEMSNPVGSLYLLATQFSVEQLKAAGIPSRTVGTAVIQPVLPLTCISHRTRH